MKDLDALSLRNIGKMTEDEARAHVEAIRWPDGPTCPRCNSRNVTPIQGNTKRVRKGLYRCQDCRKAKADQFTVTVGTIFEDSHVPLSKWLQAFHLVCASKKGISALQLQRNLGLGSYRTAWFMVHRIRCAMQTEPLASLLKGTVEVDETYVGGKPRHKGPQNKRILGRATTKGAVVAMVERDGRVRAVGMERLSYDGIKTAIRQHVDMGESRLMTDEYNAYPCIGRGFTGGHNAVCHSRKEYVRGNAHVNTAESFFALLKRGVHGTFHHVSKRHLHRYAHEFAFRWDHRDVTDSDRTRVALKRARGRRLMYRDLVR